MKKNIYLQMVLAIVFLISNTNTFAQAKKKDEPVKKDAPAKKEEPVKKKEEPVKKTTPAKKEVKGKFIDNKKYKVQFYEMKSTGRGKAVESMVVTSSGEIESPLMKEKIKIEPAKYEVILDSTYIEDESPMHLVKIEATVSSGKDDAKWEATILNYDIDGTVVENKNGVEKKKFEFSGTEKTKK